MSNNTYTREVENPIKLTVAVSIEIAGVGDGELAEAIGTALTDIFTKTEK